MSTRTEVLAETEPTPVRVRFAGETFTGRLLCAPNAIGLVDVENAREKLSVPARWCEALTEAAGKLLGAGDRFVGTAKVRDASAVIAPDPQAKKLPAIDGWTLREIELLRDFVTSIASRLVARGRRADGWLEAARFLKVALKEQRMRVVARDAGLTDEQRKDPNHLLREAYRQLGRAIKAFCAGVQPGQIVFSHQEEMVRSAIQHYLTHYAKLEDEATK